MNSVSAPIVEPPDPSPTARENITINLSEETIGALAVNVSVLISGLSCSPIMSVVVAII